MEEMFVMGPSQGAIEWGGPTRGGQRPEPTRWSSFHSLQILLGMC